MTKRTTTGLGLLLLLTLVPVLQGCGNDGPPRIGVFLPLSGEDAVYGEPVERGISLAQAELEKAYETGLYPYDVEVEVIDTEGDPERAAQLLSEFYDGGGVAAIGGVTDAEAAAMAPIAEEAGRVLLSPTAARPDLPTSRHFYRIALTADREASKMASFTVLDLGLQRVAVVGADEPTAEITANAFQEELERYGGKVVARVTYPEHGEIPETVVREATDSEAQAIYVADFSAHGEDLMTAIDAQGFRGVLLTTSALTAPELLASSEKVADGALVTQTLFEPEDSDNPKMQLFAGAYRERWERAPDLFAAHGYDAFQVVTHAMMTEKGRASDLWKGMRGLDEYRGVTGYLQFDEKGKAGKFPRVYVVDGGQLDPIEGMPEWQRQRLARQAP